MYFVVCVLFFTTKSGVEFFSGVAGEEGSVAADRKGRGGLPEEGLFKPSLGNQRARPGPGPLITF